MLYRLSYTRVDTHIITGGAVCNSAGAPLTSKMD